MQPAVLTDEKEKQGEKAIPTVWPTPPVLTFLVKDAIISAYDYVNFEVKYAIDLLLQKP